MQHERNPHSRHFIPLADLTRRTGGNAQAIELLNGGLVRCPDSLSARWLLGLCLLESGERKAASEQLRRVLERDPDHTLAAAALARCGSDEGKTAPPARDAQPPAAAGDTAALDPQRSHTLPDNDAEPVRTVPDPAKGTAHEPARTVLADQGQTTVTESASATPGTTATELAAGTPSADAVPAMFVTRTLADIYLAQGHKDKALRILYQVLAAHPGREDIVARITELEAGAETTATRGSATGTGAPDAGADGGNRDRFDAWVAGQDREG